jgi:hypothetical protein
VKSIIKAIIFFQEIKSRVQMKSWAEETLEKVNRLEQCEV